MRERDDIIQFIRSNRVSTTEVADALGKTGVLSHVMPITHDLHRVGPVRAVFCAHESNYAVHEQVRDTVRDDVVMIFPHACGDRAILGDLIAKFVLLYRGASALVVDGLVRDASRLRRERYPIWAQGVTPLGCFNTKTDDFPAERKAELLAQYDRGIAVCDDGGVVVIPADRINADTLERLHRIEEQEDVWYYCLNTLKWDTKRIVCDRDYLKETDLLPKVMVEKLQRIKTRLDDPASR
jgi:regulator of RNase E activity RraA